MYTNSAYTKVLQCSVIEDVNLMKSKHFCRRFDLSNWHKP